MPEWFLSLDAVPEPWSRPRFNRASGVVFNAPALRSSLAEFRWLLRAEWSDRGVQREPLDGAVVVEATFWYPRPKSVTAKRRPHHVVKPDLDNLAKTLCDAMREIVYRDDNQVTELLLRKAYGPKYRTELRVEALA
ncbi:MAG TPA: RusA family crossover junction endodeoxyribonuclease [Phycisphaerales bacterium]|nr:RusA family crossover junction endodeoxyribonuclease [Phycisphaerales bacterium]